MLKNQFKTLISESDLQTIQMMSDKLSQDSLCKDLLKIGKHQTVQVLETIFMLWI